MSFRWARAVHLVLTASIAVGGTRRASEIAAATPADTADGNGVIRATAGPAEIVITTTARLAGAIDSLSWNGKEFIDSYDHGRQLQSAANFACDGQLNDETFNPTEAGSRDDGVGQHSTSRLLKYRAQGAELESTVNMAFWLAPGQDSSGHQACNDRRLSDYLLTKRVHIGCADLPHAIQYDVTFTIPAGERRTAGTLEALTGYMPAEFDVFEKFNNSTRELEPLDSGPGEQAWPIVFSTVGGTHALGIISPDQPSKGFTALGYGRFRFPAEKVVKWNCVFRLRDAAGIVPGDLHYRMFVAIGTRDDVRATLDKLSGQFSKR